MGRGKSGSEAFLHLSVVGYEGYIASWVGRVNFINRVVVSNEIITTCTGSTGAS